MVYNREKSRGCPENLIKIKQKINSYKYKFICHVSHLSTKNKLPMLEGFAKFALSQKENDCLLILLEYGTHSQIELSKRRIKKLGVENRVLWLSKKTRKELMFLINEVDFGFSEFEGMMWGGTGWEFLSLGVPFFHYIDITPKEFKIEFSSPMPPYINTNSSDEIYRHLIKYTENPNLYKKKGKELKHWFEKYGGIGLAVVWKDIITKIYKEEQIHETI